MIVRLLSIRADRRYLRLITALAIAAGTFAGAADSEESVATVSIHTAQQTVAVPDAHGWSPVVLIQGLFGSCSFNSVDGEGEGRGSRTSKTVFGHLSPFDKTWSRYANAPHLHVRLRPAIPVVLHRRLTISVSEVLIPLRGPDYWLTRDGKSVTIHTKCSCEGTDALICAPEVRPHLPPETLAHCTAMDELRKRWESGSRPNP